MTTREMVKKRQRRTDLTGSSSSAEMGASKPPKDVLGLGRHLVRELDFEDRNDTLGRWMSHHLAELIDKAERGSTSAERLKAHKHATETILKIWEHRASLPGKAYPLASYKEVLKVLDRLRHDNNPFWYYSNHPDTKRERLADNLFDSLSRLIIALLLMKVPSEDEPAKVDAAATEALNETEQQVLAALGQWGELFISTSGNSGQGQENKDNDEVAQVNLEEAALQLINAIMTTLSELRSELQESS